MSGVYCVPEGDLAFRVIDGEAILIHFQTNFYYSLNPVGTLVWSWLQQAPASSEELAARVAQEFGRPADATRADVEQFLAQLAAEDLVRKGNGDVIAGAAASTESATTVSAAEIAYAAPELVKYDTLDRLIVSGE